jgi:hypothetical protein
MTVSQDRKRLAHDSEGWRGTGSSRFRFGGKKEAAGVCRGRGRYRYLYYIYGISIACFFIGQHIRHGCFSIRLFILTSTTARAANAAATAAPAASFLPTTHPEFLIALRICHGNVHCLYASVEDYFQSIRHSLGIATGSWRTMYPSLDTPIHLCIFSSRLCFRKITAYGQK